MPLITVAVTVGGSGGVGSQVSVVGIVGLQ